MSPATHTPGPWYVDRWALGWFVHNGDDPGDRGQRKTIAECREADHGGPFERHIAEANARLIAAAPATAAERDRLREALSALATEADNAARTLEALREHLPARVTSRTDAEADEWYPLEVAGARATRLWAVLQTARAALGLP